MVQWAKEMYNIDISPNTKIKDINANQLAMLQSRKESGQMYRYLQRNGINEYKDIRNVQNDSGTNIQNRII